MEPWLVHTDQHALIISLALLLNHLRCLRTKIVPRRHVPQLGIGSALIGQQMELAPQGGQALLLTLEKVAVIAPGLLIWLWADDVHSDRPIVSGETRLQAFQSPQEQLGLCADAIGEIVDAVICEIK